MGSLKDALCQAPDAHATRCGLRKGYQGKVDFERLVRATHSPCSKYRLCSNTMALVTSSAWCGGAPTTWTVLQ